MTVADARSQLPTLLRKLREKGEEADPVFVGVRRKPEGVLMSYESFNVLADYLDEIAIVDEVRKRLAADSGERLTEEEFFDLAEKK